MPTTVSGSIKSLLTTGVGSSTNAFVRFVLSGTQGNQPTVVGTGAIAPLQSANGQFYCDVAADANGAVSGTIYSTRDATGVLGGDISVGGSTTAVYYTMFIYNNGVAGPGTKIHAKNGATLDPSSITPITTPPVVSAPTGDGTYLRLDGGNSPVTGLTTFSTGEVTKKLNNIRFASQFSVADGGAKVNAADADLGATAGEIWVDQACGTSWTTAVSISSGHTLRFVQGGTYTVNTITLASNTALIGAGNKTVILEPQTNSQASVINIAGTNKSSGIAEFITIEGVQIFENLTPTSSATAIAVNYAANLWVRNTVCNGFYNNITLNNSSYIDFYKVRSNGATHRNLYAQFTDTTGTYFGTNFAAVDCEFDSAASGSEYSVYFSDWAGSWFINCDVTGNQGVGGMKLESINSAVDQPSGNTIKGCFFDANAGYGLFINKQRETFVEGNWFSSGRTSNNDGLQATNIDGGKFTGNVAFWCGAHGFNFNGGNVRLTITGNVSNANTSSNYRFIGLTNSTITGNQSFVKQWASGTQGALSTNGFNEDNTSSGNYWSNNISTDATTPWTLNGTSEFRVQDSMITAPQRSGPAGIASTGFLWYSNADNRWRVNQNNGGEFPLGYVVASGTATLGTGAITAGTSAAAVVVASSNVASTDTIAWAFNAAPGTGYTAGLHVLAYATSGNVNFLVVNPTAGSLTPAAATLNWRVIR